MNSIRNSVTLIGNLGQDPEVKEIQNGRMMAKIRIATNEIYTNKEGERVKQNC